MTHDISSAVNSVIRDHLDVAEERVKPEALFFEDLGAPPLGLVELACASKKAFYIDIDDEEVAKTLTVRNAITYIEKRVTAQHPE